MSRARKSRDTQTKFAGATKVTRLLLFAAAATLAFSLPGCGGGSASSSSTSTGSTTGTGTTPTNVQAITLNTGPAASAGSLAVDVPFTTITVCAPGSTTQCQTISGVSVDTGSSGLRILSSALTISLPQQNDGSGNPVVECLPFADGETWGPVQTADIMIAGEKAGSIPVQVIGSASFPTIPSACSNQGPIEDDLSSFGANALIGVGNFIQDCGPACAVSGGQNAGWYYSCPSSGCEVTTEAEAQQVANPVASFAADNNGVIIQLPSVSGPEATLSGTMTFGIGTQSNNGLGSETVYTVDPNLGNFTTIFNGQTYSDAAFLDTGSNALYFLDSNTTGLPTCTDLTFWYCPASTQNFTATNQGFNGASSTISFSVENADALTGGNNETDAVAPGLAGPNPGTFDWGLPFFFGRTVYVAIEGKTAPGGQSPYVAY
jgi:hypothetical protein